VALDGERVLAYGMLRGWDEGFEVPSLGIAVAPSERCGGLGELLMSFLETVARRRCAPRLRLTVHSENDAAISLFLKRGYVFEPAVGERLVGYLEL
jgi:ribosomal protein S18 acetylase RimI-like enzyme